MFQRSTLLLQTSPVRSLPAVLSFRGLWAKSVHGSPKNRELLQPVATLNKVSRHGNCDLYDIYKSWEIYDLYGFRGSIYLSIVYVEWWICVSVQFFIVSLNSFKCSSKKCPQLGKMTNSVSVFFATSSTSRLRFSTEPNSSWSPCTNKIGFRNLVKKL